MSLRLPVVAGRFYPADSEALRHTIRALLKTARTEYSSTSRPKAVIAPHAGYVFSGAVAASAFSALGIEDGGAPIRRVVLLGTAHSPISGLAISRTEQFQTPLGAVPVDQHALDQIADHPSVIVDEAAHSKDHALEVQLPLLQMVLEPFAMVPILVGRCDPEAVAEILETLWDGPETAIVVSSDLSHYYPYDQARRQDRATAQTIEDLKPKALGRNHACGHRAIAGLLQVAERHGLQAKTAALRNSGDSGGPADRVVGYGAFLFKKPDQAASTAGKPSDQGR